MHGALLQHQQQQHKRLHEHAVSRQVTAPARGDVKASTRHLLKGLPRTPDGLHVRLPTNHPTQRAIPLRDRIFGEPLKIDHSRILMSKSLESVRARSRPDAASTGEEQAFGGSKSVGRPGSSGWGAGWASPVRKSKSDGMVGVKQVGSFGATSRDLHAASSNLPSYMQNNAETNAKIEFKMQDIMRSVRAKIRSSAQFSGHEDWLRLFKKFDRDGSGEIDEAEFLKLVMSSMGGPLRISSGDSISPFELHQVFARLDTSGNGGVSLEEFEAFLEGAINERGASGTELEQRRAARRTQNASRMNASRMNRSEGMIALDESRKRMGLSTNLASRVTEPFGWDVFGEATMPASVRTRAATGTLKDRMTRPRPANPYYDFPLHPVPQAIESAGDTNRRWTGQPHKELQHSPARQKKDFHISGDVNAYSSVQKDLTGNHVVDYFTGRRVKAPRTMGPHGYRGLNVPMPSQMARPTRKTMNRKVGGGESVVCIQDKLTTVRRMRVEMESELYDVEGQIRRAHKQESAELLATRGALSAEADAKQAALAEMYKKQGLTMPKPSLAEEMESQVELQRTKKREKKEKDLTKGRSYINVTT